MLFYLENLQTARGQKSRLVKTRIFADKLICQVESDKAYSTLRFFGGFTFKAGLDEGGDNDKMFFAHSGELVNGYKVRQI